MSRIPVSADYNPETDNPIYWFLNTETQLIETMVIPKEDSDSLFKVKMITPKEGINSTHEEYTENWIKYMLKDGINHLKGIDWLDQYDVLTQDVIRVARIRMDSAKAVKNYRFKTANEANIKREYRHSFDNKWYFGVPYDHEFKEIMHPIAPEIREQFNDFPPQITNRILQWCLSPIPKINRMAFDIETSGKGRIAPDPLDTPYPIISAAFSYKEIDKPAIVFVLKSEARGFKSKMVRNVMLAEAIAQKQVKVVYVNTERELIYKCFERLVEQGIPLVVTFYGVEFDLPYLLGRALLLNIPEELIPINGYRRAWKDDKDKWHFEWKVRIKGKVHLDLYKWHDLTVVKNYVFKSDYLESSLGGISQALLGVTKFKHKEPVHEMPMSDLAWYNYWDAHLTMELTNFREETTLRIIFLFMRLGRQKFEDAAHRAISSKIVNLLRGYMIEHNQVIPIKDELQRFGTLTSEAKSAGKAFRGAEIIESNVGWHDNVRLADFSSLYPTEMVKHNISFETMNCGHPECKAGIDNQIPELGHYTCLRVKGILPTLIGLIMAVRLRIFKPLAKKDKAAESVSEALKVFINASFGVTSFPQFDFYCPPAGESITAAGRHDLGKFKAKAESMGLEVIMGDTDSLALKGATKEDIEHLIQWSDEELGLELAEEYDGIFIIHSMKNYIVITSAGKMIIKGLSGKKRNTPKKIQNCFQDVINAWKELKSQDKLDQESAKSALIEIVRDYYLQMWHKIGDIEDYAFSTQMTKRITDYHKTTPIHVKAAKRLAEWIRQSGGSAYRRVSDNKLVPAGTYIKYVKRLRVRGKESNDLMKPNIESDPIPVQMASADDICSEIYQGQLLSVMSQLMIPMGVSIKEVYMLNPDDPVEQTDLAQFL